ncbi:hypothetical protein RHOER0001_4673 [Rhodococcus erythropolis SK121]|nr:hypothetical protein RHOER0001_4673 [Rhodococcus erythropolis SK121]
MRPCRQRTNAWGTSESGGGLFLRGTRHRRPPITWRRSIPVCICMALLLWSVNRALAQLPRMVLLLIGRSRRPDLSDIAAKNLQRKMSLDFHSCQTFYRRIRQCLVSDALLSDRFMGAIPSPSHCNFPSRSPHNNWRSLQSRNNTVTP